MATADSEGSSLSALTSAVRRRVRQQRQAGGSLPPPVGWQRLLAPLTGRIANKILLPYTALIVVLAGLATYVVTNLVTDSLEEKFRSELADGGRAANDAMVKLEAEQLRTVRQMTFTTGVAQALAAGDVEAVRQLLLPVQANTRAPYVDVVDASGRLVLALRLAEAGRVPDSAVDPELLIDRDAGQWAPVAEILQGREDRLGDKYSGIVPARWGQVLYTAGPVKLDGRLVAAIAVGTPLDSVVTRLAQEAVTGVTLYGADGTLLASSLPGVRGLLRVEPDLSAELLASGTRVQQRQVSVGASRYQELLGVLQVRQQPAALLGVSQSISLIAERGAGAREPLLLLFAAVGLAVIAMGVLLARQLTRPLHVLVDGCRALFSGDLSRPVPVLSRDETGELTVAFNQALHGLRERDRARAAFDRYMSPELYEAIQSGDLKLGGEKREITVLMSDIRGFTSLSEQLDPEDLVFFLNYYFESQVAAIQRYGGSVDKFMGDAILARFGAPIWYPDHAKRAALAMLDMRRALEELNERLAQYGSTRIRIGIGANTGEAVVGNIGSSSRMEYTIIGDTVNATQRIEDLCKELHWDLLIGETTYEQVKDLVEVGEPHRIRLRGRQQDTYVYPLLRRRDSTLPGQSPAVEEPAGEPGGIGARLAALASAA